MARDRFTGEAPLMEKKSFIKEGEGAIASYDWTDIAEGTGYVEFYIQEIDAGVFKLQTFPMYSYTTHTTNPAGLTADLSPFNAPKTIAGKAFLIFPLWNNTAGTFTVTGQLFKVDKSAVESAISSQISFTLSANEIKTITMEIPANITVFGKGEALRLKITSTGSGTRYLGHDPLNRTSGLSPEFVSTKMSLYIPFRIYL